MKPYREFMREMRRQYLLEALEQAGTVVAAARLIGLNRQHFFRLMAAEGIQSRNARNRGNAGWQTLAP